MITQRMVAQWRAVGCAAMLMVGLSTSRVFGQEILRPMSGFGAAIWGGGAASTSFENALAHARWLQTSGLPAGQFYDRRLRTEPGMAFGLSAWYWFNGSVGLRGRVGRSSSRLAISVSDRDLSVLPSDTAVTGPGTFGSVRVWAADAELMLRLPFSPRNRVAPYSFIGLGRLEYQATPSGGFPPEAHSLESRRRVSRLGAVVGAGALVPMQHPHLALTFEASAHMIRTPVSRGEPVLLRGDRVDVLTSLASDGTSLTAYARLMLGVAWLHNRLLEKKQSTSEF